METIFMNTENSKTNESSKSTDKLHLKKIEIKKPHWLIEVFIPHGKH